MTIDGVPPSVSVEFTSEFKRNVRQLARKYRRIKAEVVLITIYSKTEQQDITPNEIRAIIVENDKPKIGSEAEIVDMPPDGVSPTNTEV